MLYSTYFNLNSYYNKKKVTNDFDYLISGGLKGLSSPLDFLIKRTELVMEPRRINDKADQYFHDFLDKAKGVLADVDVDSLYTRFTIPKRNGKRREILAPSEELKQLQTNLVYILKRDYKILEHNAAHAYINGRSIVTNASVHKDNYNFLNVDLTNFFPSITKEVIENSLKSIANLNRVFTNLSATRKETFYKIILYKGALPQGSAASPFISNIVMIPFDYTLERLLKDKYRNVVYTRYADDLTFSSKPMIYKEDLIKLIKEAASLAYEEKFIKINPEKTRQTTYRGKNRVTGVKINAENKLSIGYKEKQQLKMDVVSLIIATKNNQYTDPSQVHETLGMLSYLNSVEPDYTKYLIRKWSRKFEIKDLHKFLIKT